MGDIFACYVNNQVPSRYFDEARAQGISIHERLTTLASKQAVGVHGLMALDWHSGNRSVLVLVDYELSVVPLGATLSTKAEDGYLALMEATAFGTRKIIETFNGGGVLVAEFVVAGGLIKSSFLMQLYCDVINLPLSLLESDQCPALGFAIHAAAASGYYSNVREAADRMGRVSKAKYRPESKRAAQYDRLYAEYQIFHDYFGRDTNDVMRRLKVLKREVAWASH